MSPPGQRARERDFMGDKRVYIMDVYNRHIYPGDRPSPSVSAPTPNAPRLSYRLCLRASPRTGALQTSLRYDPRHPREGRPSTSQTKETETRGRLTYGRPCNSPTPKHAVNPSAGVAAWRIEWDFSPGMQLSVENREGQERNRKNVEVENAR